MKQGQSVSNNSTVNDSQLQELMNYSTGNECDGIVNTTVCKHKHKHKIDSIITCKNHTTCRVNVVKYVAHYKNMCLFIVYITNECLQVLKEWLKPCVCDYIGSRYLCLCSLVCEWACVFHFSVCIWRQTQITALLKQTHIFYTSYHNERGRPINDTHTCIFTLFSSLFTFNMDCFTHVWWLFF